MTSEGIGTAWEREKAIRRLRRDRMWLMMALVIAWLVILFVKPGVAR
jgi:uncharacterized membrane protein